MGQLNNQYVSSSFQGLLKMTNSTTGVTNTLQTIQTGDGTDTPLQISKTEVNISGSLTVNGLPISFDTGSFATTGSNIFTGKQTITGSNGRLIYDGTTNATPNNTLAEIHTDNDSPWLERFYNDSFSTSSSVMSYFGWNDGRFIFHNDSTQSIAISVDGYDNDNLVVGNTNTTSNNDFIISGSLHSSDIIGTGSLFLQPNQSDARLVEIYNTSPTDTHITASGGQIFLGDDQTYVKVDNYGSVERIDIVAGNELVVSSSVINLTGSLYQSGTFYPDVIDWISSSIVQNTGSYILTTNASGVTQYDSYANVAIALGQFSSSGTSGTSGTDGSSGTSGQDGSSGTSGTSGGTGSSGTSGTSGSSGTAGTSGSSGVSPSLVGVITTGSITTTQAITGSLILGNTVISGSLIGNVDNSGIIKIQSQLHSSSSLAIPFGYISSSNPDLQTNIMFGSISASSGSGLLTNGLTGSIVISGSNNIMLGTGNRPNTLVTAGTYGYLGGGNNIGTTIPTLNTGSVLRPSISNNALQSSLALQFTTSSLGQPSISSNLIYGSTIINHQSGSINYLNNLNQGGVTSTANNIALPFLTTIQQNYFGGSQITLQHISSSITATNNIVGGSNFTVTNLVSSSVSTTNNGLSFNNNFVVGSANGVWASGSNTTNRRTVISNIIGGTNTAVSSSQVGADTHLVSSIVYGQNLIVSASHASSVGGSTFVGRFNATGSLQESTQDAVFVVGTGTGVGSRRNGLHIDSSSNFRITGSVLVSGSLNTTGNINDLKIHTGSVNVDSIGIGTNTLLSLTGSSLSNIAIGNSALRYNVTGANIVAIGSSALQNSLDGFNTAIGATALGALISGGQNMAIGQSAIQSLTGGTKNTAIGFNTMVNVVSGSNNTAIGAGTLQRNTNGSGCVVIGNQAGSWSTTSNEFFIGNDNFGSADGERSGSLMWGNFANPISGQNLRINANTKIIGDVLFSSGSNKTMGTAVLDGGNPGTVVVSNTLVTASSIIMLTKQTNNHPNAGPVVVSSKGSSTFTITSNHNGDSDTVAYLIINPA